MTLSTRSLAMIAIVAAALLGGCTSPFPGYQKAGFPLEQENQVRLALKQLFTEEFGGQEEAARDLYRSAWLVKDQSRKRAEARVMKTGTRLEIRMTVLNQVAELDPAPYRHEAYDAAASRKESPTPPAFGDRPPIWRSLGSDKALEETLLAKLMAKFPG